MDYILYFTNKKNYIIINILGWMYILLFLKIG